MKQRRIAAVVLGLVVITTACPPPTEPPPAPPAPSFPTATVTSTDATGIDATIAMPSTALVPIVEGGTTYQQVQVPGTVSVSPEGSPELPSYTEQFAIPQGASVSVSVAPGRVSSTSGLLAWPAQPSTLRLEGAASPPFTIDEEAYGTDAYVPSELATFTDLGMVGGVHIGAVSVATAQYNPVRQELRRFDDIALHVSFTGGTAQFADPGLDNPWDASTLKMLTGVLNGRTAKASIAGSGPPVITGCGEEMMIITREVLAPEAQRLADARSRAGVRTRVFVTDGGAHPIGTSTFAITNTILGEFLAPCVARPHFVLLFGDTTSIPTFIVPTPTIPDEMRTPWGTKDVATDDGYSLNHSLAVGRLPVDVDTAHAVVDKTIGYEDRPPGSVSPSPTSDRFYSHTTIASQFQTDDGPDGSPDCGSTSLPTDLACIQPQAGQDFISSAEALVATIVSDRPGHQVDRLYTADAAANPTCDTAVDLPVAGRLCSGAYPASLRRPAYPWNADTASVAAAINQGSRLVIHDDHGFGDGSGWAHPEFTVSSLGRLNNGSLLPLVISNDCDSGQFDALVNQGFNQRRFSFAEMLVRMPSGGAWGVIAASRTTATKVSTVFVQHLIEELEGKPDGRGGIIRRSGDGLPAEALRLAKLDTIADRYRSERSLLTIAGFNFFGDPSARLQERPRTLMPSDSFKGTVLGAVFGASPALAVQFSTTTPAAEGAVVTMVRGNTAVGRGVIANGRVTVTDQLGDGADGVNGPLRLVVDQPGYSPTIIDFGVVTSAGATGQLGTADGIGSAARFNNPTGIAVDATGNQIVSDSANHTIRSVTPAGLVSTIAGTPGVAGHADGPSGSASFNAPTGVAVGPNGDIYVGDTGNHTIRRITPAGDVTTIAGSPGLAGSADGPGDAARFNGPEGLTVDPWGNVYVTDTGNHTIRRITPTGEVVTLAGASGVPGSADGSGPASRFSAPEGITYNAHDGTLVVADSGNNTIRTVTIGGLVTTVAGLAGTPGGSDGVGSTARFNRPLGIAADPEGNLYVADGAGATIRTITVDGTVTTIAGSAGATGHADGPGPVARFFFPSGVAFDPATGAVHVADTGNHVIRRLRWEFAT